MNLVSTQLKLYSIFIFGVAYYAKDNGSLEVLFFAVFTMSLCGLDYKQTMILLFQIARFEVRYAGSEKLFEADLSI